MYGRVKMTVYLWEDVKLQNWFESVKPGNTSSPIAIPKEFSNTTQIKCNPKYEIFQKRNTEKSSISMKFFLENYLSARYRWLVEYISLCVS